MLRTLKTAETAMHLEQTRIDTLAHNLANIDATGFKQVLTRVAEQASGGVSNPGAGGMPFSASTRLIGDANDAWPVQRPLVMSQAFDRRQGELQVTGRATDLALEGQGFFVVRDAQGHEYYTRDGAFRVDDKRQLVTSGGLAVQGSGGAITLDGKSFDFAQDGSVIVDGNSPGKLRLVTFDDVNHLEHRGDGLLAAPDDMPPQPVTDGAVTVTTGFLETSNVDAVQTLVDMIQAQRAFEIESKVLRANDELLSHSTNTLGRVNQ